MGLALTHVRRAVVRRRPARYGLATQFESLVACAHSDRKSSRVALRNRVRIETLMTLIRKDEIFRKADSLPQGLEKGEPLYWAYAAFQALMFVLMGLALLGAVEPFLSGQPGVESVFRAFNALLGFVVSTGTWQYVKESNRAAGKALVLIARGL